MTWAFNQQLDPAPKLVLLALANRTNHDTGLCFPGQTLIGHECSMSDRTVRRHLKTLEQLGLVSRRPRMLGEGRGRTSDEYRISFYDQPDNVSGRSGLTGQIVPTNRTNQDDQPDTVVQVTVREPKENRKAPRKSAIPDGWQPSPELQAELTARYPQLNIGQEVEKFREWHGAKGNTFVDYGKAFRLWVRNAQRFVEQQPKRKPDGVGNGGVFF